MGGACSTMGVRRGVNSVLVGNPKRKRLTGKEEWMVGWIILRLIFRKWDAEAWPGLIIAQDRDRWRALVNAVP